MSTPPPGGNVCATSSARSLDQKVLLQNALSSGMPTPAAKESHSVDQLYEASPQVKKEVRLVHCELPLWGHIKCDVCVMCVRQAGKYEFSTADISHMSSCVCVQFFMHIRVCLY